MPGIRLASLRVSLLERLKSRVASGIHSNIVGGPGTGKTALMNVLQALARVNTSGALLIAAIDPNELTDATSSKFWDLVAKATDTPRDRSQERYIAVLQQLRARRQRLLLVIHKLDELVSRPWASDAQFLGRLRIFANAAGSPSELGPVSLIATSRRTLSGIHGYLEKRLGRFPGSPPLNFMQDLPLEPRFGLRQRSGDLGQRRCVGLRPALRVPQAPHAGCQHLRAPADTHHHFTGDNHNHAPPHGRPALRIYARSIALSRTTGPPVGDMALYSFEPPPSTQ